nr:integrase, catalytic region, zinc finger, CCHC-type, peptidase aspartic, catalytic [Tanacetum cinerariifolium]
MSEARIRAYAKIGGIPNGEALRKCILSGHYKPTTVLVQAVAATDDSLVISEHATIETPMNMSPANKAHFEAEKEAIHLILTGIRDEIYSTVDACQTGKEIAKPITPPSETASEEDNDPEHAQRDKDMQKNLALIAKYFKKIYKPTNNNLRTSLNLRNKNVDTTLRYKNDNNLGYSVLTARSLEILPRNAESQKGLRTPYTDEKIDERELEAHYSYIAKIQETEFEKYKAFNDRTVDYEKLERELNETLGQLAQNDIEIKEGLKTKAYEISMAKEKHDELIKQSLLTKSHYEGLVKQKTKVITDLKLMEEHDIDKMLSMEKQLKFLNEIVYKRSQLIQTIHMMALKVPTYNSRPTFANPRYLKQAQSKIPCLYAFLYDQSTHENRLIPDGEETLALERESRSKLNKDLVLPYDYTTLNSQLQNKNIAISELKKLIEKGKGKYVDTKFDKPSVVRQPNAQRIPKPSVLGNPDPFSNSLERRYFPKTKSVPKTNVSEGSFEAESIVRAASTRVRFRLLTTSFYLVRTHMTGNLKLLCNFVEKFMGTVHFNNDQFAPILGYGDLGQGNVTINMVYYVEGLNHNLFSIGQFCDADLEVAFRKSTCFVRDLQGNDLLI